MSPALRTALWLVLAATLLVALAIGAFLAWGLTELLPAGTRITIDGKPVDLDALRPAQVGHWVMATIGVLIAAMVIVVVVPLVVVLSIFVPLLFGAFGIALALLVVALAASPLLLLLWWLWKNPKRSA